MPLREEELYNQLLRMIEDGQAPEAVNQIMQFDDKYEQVYAVSRLYKGIYPHVDIAAELSTDTELNNILKTVAANAFLFDLALSVVTEADLKMDIRSDLQHALTLKRMIAHAFKEAIDLDFALNHPLMLELDTARSILQTIITALKKIAQAA